MATTSLSLKTVSFTSASSPITESVFFELAEYFLVTSETGSFGSSIVIDCSEVEVVLFSPHEKADTAERASTRTSADNFNFFIKKSSI